jgi:stage III sporulation protein AG
MNYLETMKNILKDKKKKKENMIFIAVLLVVLLISINYIFSDTKKEQKGIEIDNNTNEKVDNNTQSQNTNTLEERLTQIINQVDGISDVSLIINYKDSGQSEYVFNTKETIAEEGNVLNLEKEVAYNESSGQKSAIKTSQNNPQIEGVIIVARGIENSENKQKIQSAIASLLGIASYKVQVLNRR